MYDLYMDYENYVVNEDEAEDKRSILIIDDDDISRLILFELLKKDYDVKQAFDGATGVRIAQESEIDLILLDINMPDMSGFEVCTLLKNDAKTEEIPIIFITAKVGTSDKTKAFMIGALDYITKPFESKEMLARIETHLRLIGEMRNLSSYNQRLNEILKEQTRELIRTERHALFSIMIKGIVHNLRNPLGAMLGANEIVLKNAQKAMELKSKEDVYKALEKIEKFSNMIDRSISNLNDMVDSMMAKSRQDNIQDNKRVNLIDIINKELEFLKADRRFKAYLGDNITIKHSRLIIEVVPSEISQVFHNLITNALDALYNQSNAEIWVELGRINKKCYFRVIDNGPGIPYDVEKRIFEPFYTTKIFDDSPDRKPGTGLGLYTSREIIRKYRGEILLKTSEGNGAEFTIYLPDAEGDLSSS